MSPARFLRSWLAVAAAVLLLTLGLPHQHDHGAASHPTQSCRACRIQEAGAATPAEAPETSLTLVLVARLPARRTAQPQRAVVFLASGPRAPPVLS